MLSSIERAKAAIPDGVRNGRNCSLNLGHHATASGGLRGGGVKARRPRRVVRAVGAQATSLDDAEHSPTIERVMAVLLRKVMRRVCPDRNNFIRVQPTNSARRAFSHSGGHSGGHTAVHTAVQQHDSDAGRERPLWTGAGP